MFEPLLAASRRAVLVEEAFCLLPEQLFAWVAVQRMPPDVARRGQLTTLVGPPGSGKSLLVRQALRQHLKAHPRSRVACLPATEWSEALRVAQDVGRAEAFADWCGGLSAVVCEDLAQALTTAEEADHWANWLDDLLVRGVRVTVTLPAPIGTLAGHSPRLVSRLHGGLTASLPPLSAGSRRELVKRLASARQLPLTDDVLDWLIELPPGTPRTLTQLLDRIATAAASGRRPDLAAVRRWIQPAAPSDRVSLGRIAAVVADDFGITLGELRSESRQQALRLPRQCAMYLAHAVGGWPMERIGRYFGRRAHTSVSHNCRKLQELLPQAPSLQDQLQRLQARLWEHPREECG